MTLRDPDTKDEPRNREIYVKPRLQRVSLQPEEAVLGACKLSSLAGPAQAHCNSPTTCNSLHS